LRDRRPAAGNDPDRLRRPLPPERGSTLSMHLPGSRREDLPPAGRRGWTYREHENSAPLLEYEELIPVFASVLPKDFNLTEGKPNLRHSPGIARHLRPQVVYPPENVGIVVIPPCRVGEREGRDDPVSRIFCDRTVLRDRPYRRITLVPERHRLRRRVLGEPDGLGEAEVSPGRRSLFQEFSPSANPMTKIEPSAQRISNVLSGNGRASIEALTALIRPSTPADAAGA